MAEKKREVKVFPQNSDNERGILSAIIIDEMVALKAIPLLEEDDFGDNAHKLIFKAMQFLFTSGKGIDVYVLVDTLNKKGELDAVGGLAYLTEIQDAIPSAVYYMQYISALKRDSMLRKLIALSKQIEDDAYTLLDEQDALSNAQSYILQLSQTRTNSKLVHAAKPTAEAIMDINDRVKNPSSINGLETGFENLDALTNGLQKSDLILVAARPSVGKTAFALNIAANIIKRDSTKNILVFSMEMPAMQLVRRMMSNISQIRLSDMMRGSIEESELDKLWSASAILSNKDGDGSGKESGLFIDDTARERPSDILSKCKQFILAKGSLDLVIVDYLGLMSSDKPRDNHVIEVSEISRDMKLLAKQLNLPVILIAQLSRSVEIRRGKPQLSDLRDSGAIEQDADIVMFLHKQKNQPENDVLIELIVAKHRNGKCDNLAFQWLGDTVTFVSQDKSRLEELQELEEKEQEELRMQSGGKPLNPSRAKSPPIPKRKSETVTINSTAQDDEQPINLSVLKTADAQIVEDINKDNEGDDE